MEEQVLRLRLGLNVYKERQRLSTQQLARWQGLPLCWVDASASAETRRVVSERPVLALLDTGEAQAELEYALRSVRLDITAGAMGFFLPGETRRSRWRCSAARRVIVDLDPQAWVRQGLCDPLDSAPASLHEDLEFRDAGLAELLRAMSREIAAGCPNGRLYAESASLAVMASLRARFGSDHRLRRERGRLSPSQLARVNDHIDRELANELSLASMAAVACLSVPHFARLFRNATGLSPHRHVVRTRVRRACELLQHTKMPLALVARVCGFASQSHMNKTLCSSVGTTPGRIRGEASEPGFPPGPLPFS